jgi:integrase/recombinase XerD
VFWTGSWRCWARPAWEATAEDVDRVVGGLAADGFGVVDQAGICAGVQGVSPVSESREAVEIDALFGVRLVCQSGRAA